MEHVHYQDLTAALLPAVLEAGRVQLAHRARGFAVDRKADLSPVTAADHEAETILVAGLAAIAPGVPVVAEEQAAVGSTPPVGARFFLVDPLDGTKEFIHGRSEFTINVALVENSRPVYGLIYAPALGRLFATLSPGEPVEVQIAPDPRLAGEPVHWQPMATREPDPDALVALISKSHMNAETEAVLARYRIAERRAIGSSLKFCLIARGEADIHPRIGPTSEWDTAAGQAIVEAAGGQVSDVMGRPLAYGKAAERFRNPGYIVWGRRPLPPRS